MKHRPIKFHLLIRKEDKSIRMEVRDDGRSFDVDAEFSAPGNKHLGLLGMRERAEMIGGVLQIESAPGKGTTVIARIPATKTTLRQWQTEERKSKPNTP